MSDDDNKHSLVPVHDATLDTSRPKAARVLPKMVSETLALAREVPLFKILEHEWCQPDYTQILIWAEQLGLEPQEVVRRLIDGRDSGTECRDGKILNLKLDLGTFPVPEFRWADGLQIKELHIIDSDPDGPVPGAPESWYEWIKQRVDYDRLQPDGPTPESWFNWLKETEIKQPGYSDESSTRSYIKGWVHSHGRRLSPAIKLRLPNLRTLDCSHLLIDELDLQGSPFLEVLLCSYNRLKQLDLSPIPLLRRLDCSSNKIRWLSTEAASALIYLDCASNELRDLDLAGLTNLQYLDCGANNIHELDLSAVPNLEHLSCDINQLPELDIRMLQKLKKLSYGNDDLDPEESANYPESVRLIQRSDQQFT